MVEAIAQNVVKSPILPDEASRGKLEEKTSSKFSERYRDYIDLGYTVWEQDYNNHKIRKKSTTFYNGWWHKNCDDVKEYLEYLSSFKKKYFYGHTNKEGKIDEGNL